MTLVLPSTHHAFFDQGHIFREDDFQLRQGARRRGRSIESNRRSQFMHLPTFVGDIVQVTSNKRVLEHLLGTNGFEYNALTDMMLGGTFQVQAVNGDLVFLPCPGSDGWLAFPRQAVKKMQPIDISPNVVQSFTVGGIDDDGLRIAWPLGLYAWTMPTNSLPLARDEDNDMYMIRDVEQVLRTPTIGVLVRRGPDLELADDDFPWPELVGITTEIIDGSTDLVRVLWFNGSEGIYAVGANGKFELAIAKTDVLTSPIFGLTVKKGPGMISPEYDSIHWSMTGTTFDDNVDDGWCAVRWSDGQVFLYQVGANGNYDLILEPDNATKPKTYMWDTPVYGIIMDNGHSLQVVHRNENGTFTAAHTFLPTSVEGVSVLTPIDELLAYM